MYDDGMNVDSVLCYRYILATFFLAALMIARHESFRITLKETMLLFSMGLMFSVSSITLFISYQYIDVSIASTLLFCYPAFVAIIMMTMFKEKPDMTSICSIVLVGIGIVVLNADSYGTLENMVGIAIVILSSLVYAVYMVFVQKTCISKLSSLKVAFYSILFGSTIYIIRLKGMTELQTPPTYQSGICALALAIFPTLVSITTLALAIRYIGSTATAILGSLEPVTAVLIGIIILGERPSILAYLGMIIILAAVTVLVAAPKLKTLTKNKTIINIGKDILVRGMGNNNNK